MDFVTGLLVCNNVSDSEQLSDFYVTATVPVQLHLQRQILYAANKSIGGSHKFCIASQSLSDE